MGIPPSLPRKCSACLTLGANHMLARCFPQAVSDSEQDDDAEGESSGDEDDDSGKKKGSGKGDDKEEKKGRKKRENRNRYGHCAWRASSKRWTLFRSYARHARVIRAVPSQSSRTRPKTTAGSGLVF